MAGMKDESWVSFKVLKSVGGDNEAFLELVEEYQHVVIGYIAMLGVPNDYIDKVAQETFATAYAVLDRYDGKRPIKPWLRNIARLMVLEWRTVHGAALSTEHRELFSLLFEQDIDSFTAESEELFTQTLLKDCMVKLPPEAKQVLRLKYRQNKNSDDVAVALKQEPEVVRVLLNRVRMMIRELIAQAMIEETGHL